MFRMKIKNGRCFDPKSTTAQDSPLYLTLDVQNHNNKVTYWPLLPIPYANLAENLLIFRQFLFVRGSQCFCFLKGISATLI